MNRVLVLVRAAAALCLVFLPVLVSCSPAPVSDKYRSAQCFVIIKQGASAEGNALFLRKMALESGLLSRVEPTRFATGPRFSLTRAGKEELRSQAEEPVLVERRGVLALYSVDFKIEAQKLPRAQKTVTVDFSLADLAKTGDLLQPSDKALLLAAADAGMRSGVAWIIEMQMPAKGQFRATVGLSRK